MYNQNTELMKAYSKFEIQIDYYELLYKCKDDLKDLLVIISESNEITYTKRDPWPQPSTVSFTDSRVDTMLDDFRDDYVGPYNSIYHSDLADYKDTIN